MGHLPGALHLYTVFGLFQLNHEGVALPVSTNSPLLHQPRSLQISGRSLESSDAREENVAPIDDACLLKLAYLHPQPRNNI